MRKKYESKFANLTTLKTYVKVFLKKLFINVFSLNEELCTGFDDVVFTKNGGFGNIRNYINKCFAHPGKSVF